ncbi:MAG: hypothetical protein ABW095_15975 [Candidatus Thiodiazotropha sp.]
MNIDRGRTMYGIDPHATLQKIATRLDSLSERDEIVTALDEVEYVFEVIPPEMQDTAEQIIALLRQKLEQAG